MENTCALDAFDLYKGRVNLIKKGAERLGLSIIHAAVRDAATGVCEKQYDRVLCDVPCSGLGVIRRKPEIRYKKQESFKELPALQLKILEHSAQLVRPGGMLFYSTCTLRNAENGAVVTEFLKRHSEFEPYDLPETVGITHTVNEPKFMRTMMPMDHGGDGFFAAAMRSISSHGAIRQPTLDVLIWASTPVPPRQSLLLSASRANCSTLRTIQTTAARLSWSGIV